jgi:CheY-like chemotaxis protein
VSAGTTKPTLLVVDDDLAVRKLLERIAMRSGFDVMAAKDGQNALEILEVQTFDIVVVDLMMPRVSGYDLVQRISGISPRPTVVVATAMTNGDVARLDDSLVRRVIRKPFDIEAVAKTLIEVAAEVAAGREVVPPEPVKVLPPEEIDPLRPKTK